MARPRKMKWDAGMLARVGILSALCTVLSFFPEIPLTFFAPWLKLDFSFVPMLLTGYSLGLLPALVVVTIKNVFRLLTTDTQFVGQIADQIVAMSLLVPALLVYQRKRSRKGALVGMAIGTVALIAAGVLSNRYFLIPLYFGDGFRDFLSENPAYLWAAVAPFNLVKGVAVCAVTYLLYKPLSPFLRDGLKA